MIQTILNLTGCPSKTVITIELPESKKKIVENWLEEKFKEYVFFTISVGDKVEELKNITSIFTPEEGLIKITYN